MFPDVPGSLFNHIRKVSRNNATSKEIMKALGIKHPTTFYRARTKFGLHPYIVPGNVKSKNLRFSLPDVDKFVAAYKESQEGKETSTIALSELSTKIADLDKRLNLESRLRDQIRADFSPLGQLSFKFDDLSSHLNQLSEKVHEERRQMVSTQEHYERMMNKRLSDLERQVKYLLERNS